MKAAAAIDRALLETKGPEFMDRLRGSLPHVHTRKDETSWGKLIEAGETEADTEKHCECDCYHDKAASSYRHDAFCTR